MGGKNKGKLAKFLLQFTDIKEGQRVTHTGLDGGRWHIPQSNVKKLYKCINYDFSKKIPLPLLVEKMGDILPFMIDLDFKYKDKIENKAYTNNLTKRLSEYIWTVINENIELDETQNEVLVMEKSKPYPV